MTRYIQNILISHESERERERKKDRKPAVALALFPKEKIIKITIRETARVVRARRE